MSGRQLVGVGVGPGDPDLVTVKAVKVLQAADLVLVPTMDTEQVGRAEATVRHHVDHDRIRRLYFALNERDDQGPRRAAWDEAGRVVADAFDGLAGCVAFATIGDPNVYSTFSYLAATVRELVPDVQVSSVPGITAMQHLAAEAGVPLVEGQESLTLYPMTAGLDGYREALRRSDTVVAYKGGRHLPAVLAALSEHASARAGAQVVVGSQLGLADQQLLVGDEVAQAQHTGSALPYLSTVLAAPAARTRGGRL